MPNQVLAREWGEVNMETYTLEQLTKSEDIRVRRIANRLIELDFPKHAHFEIILRHVIV